VSTNNGTNWEPIVLSGDTGAVAMTTAPRNLTLRWNWSAQPCLRQKSLLPNVIVRLTPEDADGPGSSVADTLEVLKLLSDYDHDGTIGVGDFATLRTAWTNQDTTKNIGPYTIASGDAIPNITPVQDGKIDFEDLMAFVMLWDWAGTQNRIARVAQVAMAKPAEMPGSAPVILWATDEGVEIRLSGSSAPEVAGIALTLPPGLAAAARFERGDWCGSDGWWLSFSDTTTGTIEVWATRSSDGSALSPVIGRLVIPSTARDVSIGVAYDLRHEGRANFSGAFAQQMHLVRAPEQWNLSQSAPNPFNPITTMRYEVPAQARVCVAVFNALGQEVVVLVDEERMPGRYAVSWDATNHAGQPVGSGVYLIKLEAAGTRLVRRVTLVK
jgi:hypothetical protein